MAENNALDYKIDLYYVLSKFQLDIKNLEKPRMKNEVNIVTL